MDKTRPDLETWTVTASITFKARGKEGSVGAVAVAHAIADAMQKQIQHLEVVLGEDYTQV